MNTMDEHKITFLSHSVVLLGLFFFGAQILSFSLLKIKQTNKIIMENVHQSEQTGTVYDKQHWNEHSNSEKKSGPRFQHFQFSFFFLFAESTEIV